MDDGQRFQPRDLKDLDGRELDPETAKALGEYKYMSPAFIMESQEFHRRVDELERDVRKAMLFGFIAGGLLSWPFAFWILKWWNS